MFFLAALLVGLPLAFALRESLDEGWREIASSEVLRQREVVYIPAVMVFVVHAEPPVALRAVSPHLGEQVAYCPSASVFQAVHGSLWDRQGRWLDGPAPRGLDRVALRVRDGSIEINVSRVTRGPDRGPVEINLTGRLCRFEDPADGERGFLSPPTEE